jgi:hypothetical protein
LRLEFQAKEIENIKSLLKSMVAKELEDRKV